MFAVSVLQSFVFMLVASSLIAVSNSVYCTSTFDCTGPGYVESCCNQKCVSSISCKGYSCSKDSDCGGREAVMGLTCCRGTCKYKASCKFSKKAETIGKHFLRYLGPRLWGKLSTDVRSAKT